MAVSDRGDIVSDPSAPSVFTTSAACAGAMEKSMRVFMAVVGGFAVLGGCEGPAGPQGADGEDGDNGADGATGAAGSTGPAGPAGGTGSAGATGPTGPEGSVIGLVFLGERDGSALNLPDVSVTPFADVPGAGTADGDVLYGTGAMKAASFDVDVVEPGMYELSLDAAWAVSLSSETVVAWFVLDCGGGDGNVVAEQEVKSSHGYNGSFQSQAHTPFTVESFVEVAGPGQINCALQYELEVAGDGTSILFNGVDGYVTAEAYFVGP